MDIDDNIDNEHSNEHLLSQFLRHVEETPHNIAIVYYQHAGYKVNLTYQELFNRSTFLAQQIETYYSQQIESNKEKTLTHHSLKDAHVVLCLPRSEWLFCYQVAIAMCGAVVAPLSDKVSIDFVKDHLVKLKPALIITDDFNRTRFNNAPEELQRKIYVQFNMGYKRTLIDDIDENRIINTNFQYGSALYCLFNTGTSGSHHIKISKPPEKLFRANLKEYLKTVNNSNLGIMLCTSHITFDVAHTQMWAAIAFGHCLCTSSDPRNTNLQAYIIKDIKPTVVQMTNSLWRIFLECNTHKIACDKDFSETLKQASLVSCGEALTKEVKTCLLKLSNHLVDCYGLTELGDVVACSEYQVKNSADDKKNITCSQFIPFEHIMFDLDDNGKLSILLSEDVVEKKYNYFYADDLFKNSFSCDEEQNIISFKTDDIFVSSDDLGISFKHQTKLSKSKTVLNSETLKKLNSIFNKKINTYELLLEETKNQTLIATYSRKRKNIPVEQIKQEISNLKLSEKNPIIYLGHYSEDQIPLNNHFKFQLSQPFIEKTAHSTLEKELCAVISNLSNKEISAINLTFNQFAIDSDTRINLQSWILENKKKLIPEKFINHENTTIELLAKKISQTVEIKLSHPSGSVSNLISPIEQRLLLSNNFNLVYYVEINGNLNIGKLAHAVDKVVNHHENLRTIFKSKINSSNEFIRKIKHNLSGCLKKLDLDNNSIDDIIKTYQSKDYLTRGEVLYDIALYNENATKYHLIFSFHHALVDGISIRNIIRDIQNFLDNHEPIHAATSTQLAKYKIDQYQAEKENVNYWENIFITPEYKYFLHDSSPPTNESVHKKFELSGDLVESLQKLAIQTNSSLSEVLTSLIAGCINRFIAEPHATVIIADHNRPINFRNTVGIAIKLLPIQIFTHDNPKILDLIIQTKETIYKMNHVFPINYYNLMNKSKNINKFAITIDTMPLSSLNIDQCTTKIEEYFPPPKDFSLIFHYTTDHCMNIHAKSECYTESAIQYFSDTLKLFITNATKLPSMNLFDLPILTKEAKLSYQKNANISCEAPQKNILEFFSLNSTEEDDNPNLVYVNSKMHVEEYKKSTINLKANKIAYYLMNLIDLKTIQQKQPRIVIFVEHAPLGIQCFFACIKANMIPIFVNPHSSIEKIERQILNIEANYIISDDETFSKFNRQIECSYNHKNNVYNINFTIKIPSHINILNFSNPEISDEIEKSLAHPNILNVKWENVAYAVFTSGTSRDSQYKDKCVAITHEALSIAIESWLKEPKLDINNNNTIMASFVIGSDGWIYTLLEFIFSKKLIIDDSIYLSTLKNSDSECTRMINTNNMALSIVEHQVNKITTLPSIERKLHQNVCDLKYKLKIVLAGESPGQEITRVSASAFGLAETVIYNAHKQVTAGDTYSNQLGEKLNHIKFILHGNHNSTPPLYTEGQLSIIGKLGKYLNYPNHPSFRTTSDNYQEFITQDLVSFKPDGIDYLHRITDVTECLPLERFISNKLSEISACRMFSDASIPNVYNLFLELKPICVDKGTEKKYHQRFLNDWHKFYEKFYLTDSTNKQTKGWVDSISGNIIPDQVIEENFYQCLSIIEKAVDFYRICLIGAGISDLAYLCEWAEKQHQFEDKQLEIIVIDNSNCLYNLYKNFFKNIKYIKTKLVFHCCSIEVTHKKINNQMFDAILVLSVMQYLTPGVISSFLSKCSDILSDDGVIVFDDAYSIANRETETLEKIFYEAFSNKNCFFSSTPTNNYKHLKIFLNDYLARQKQLYINSNWFKKVCSTNHLDFINIIPKIVTGCLKYRERWVVTKNNNKNITLLSDYECITLERLFKQNLNDFTKTCYIDNIPNPNSFLPILKKLQDNPDRKINSFVFENSELSAEKPFSEKQLIKNSQQDSPLLYQLLSKLKTYNISYNVFLDNKKFIIMLNPKNSSWLVKTRIDDSKNELNFSDPWNTCFREEIIYKFFSEVRKEEMSIPPVNIIFTDLPLSDANKVDTKLLAQFNVSRQCYDKELPPIAEKIRTIWARVLKIDKQFIGPDTRLNNLNSDSLTELAIVDEIIEKVLKKSNTSDPLSSFKINSHKKLSEIAEEIEQYHLYCKKMININLLQTRSPQTFYTKPLIDLEQPKLERSKSCNDLLSFKLNNS